MGSGGEPLRAMREETSEIPPISEGVAPKAGEAVPEQPTAEGSGEIPPTPPEAPAGQEPEPEERSSRFRRAFRGGRRMVSPALATLLVAGATTGIASWHVWGQKGDEETTPVAGLPTPTPSEAAGTPTPERTPTPTLVYEGDTRRPEPVPLIFRGLKPGESFYAPDGSIVVGDVAVDGRVMYDSNQETGLIVVLRMGARIDAPWGADVQLNTKPEDIEEILNQDIQTMKESGCVGGCETVDVVVFPGGKPQGQ